MLKCCMILMPIYMNNINAHKDDLVYHYKLNENPLSSSIGILKI